jgi:hypothetical protein
MGLGSGSQSDSGSLVICQFLAIPDPDPDSDKDALAALSGSQNTAMRFTCGIQTSSSPDELFFWGDWGLMTPDMCVIEW